MLPEHPNLKTKKSGRIDGFAIRLDKKSEVAYFLGHPV